MWSNSIVALATVTLARAQSAVAVAPWLPACLTARDNLGRQTRGDSNSLSPSVALLLSLSSSLCLSPSERIRWGVGWKQCISQASLVWIYSCPYVSPCSLFLPQITLFLPSFPSFCPFLTSSILHFVFYSTLFLSALIWFRPASFKPSLYSSWAIQPYLLQISSSFRHSAACLVFLRSFGLFL